MCLLIFQFGCGTNHNAPSFLLCSNRDETFQRSTLSGCYYAELDGYCPIDQVAGGTWIALSGKSDGRFAIILNFHLHRYGLLAEWEEPPEPKSRGLIPHLFLESDEQMTPAAFAHDLLTQRASYQGYNLILGDKNSCCYVSNCCNLTLELDPGILYGITNGMLSDEWPKVSTAKREIGLVLENAALSSSPEAARAMCERLFEIMKDSTPLPDATYGTMIPEFMKLSAICVPPFDWNGCPYGTRTITIAVSLPGDRETKDCSRLLVVEHNRPSPDLPLQWDRQETLMPFTPFFSLGS
jgi:uncharacterized protein with NRDE domain